MKKIAFTIVSFLMLNNAFSQTEKLQYEKGKLVFNGEKISNINGISNILLSNPTPALMESVDKYKSNANAATVLEAIGGFAMGWPVGGAIAGKPFNTGLFAGGVGVSALSFIVLSAANKHLRNAVDIYNNSANKPQSSLSPLFYQDTQSGFNMGLQFNF